MLGIADRPKAVQRLQQELMGFSDGIAILHRFETKDRVVPSPLIKQLEGLHRPLQEVLDAFGIDPATGWEPAGLRKTSAIWFLNWLLVERVHRKNIDRLEQEKREGEHLAAHLQGVLALHQAASLAIAQVGQNKQDGHGGDRRRPDIPRDRAVHELIALYRRETGREAGRSWDPDTDKATGPLVRFLVLGLKLLGFPVTPSAARALIVRHRKGKLRIEP